VQYDQAAYVFFNERINLAVNFVFMQRNLIVTKDGSHSIEIPELQVSYHSVHGAIQESLHVFIQAGLQYWCNQHSSIPSCTVFEMGFGTGLNALLTVIEAGPLHKKILYHAVEAFPLEAAITQQLNYCNALQRPDCIPVFNALHESEWNKPVAITDCFTLNKAHTLLANFTTSEPVDIIYYDAFAPAAQPELWTEAVFQQLFSLLAPEGILVTYCSKGDVRRAMLAAGFTIEKIPGATGKREMIRATRNAER
jgi:tRNA U34 5-methylaminomethyl-2-thiouridine-forming methyltransferase MnmC